MDFFENILKEKVVLGNKALQQDNPVNIAFGIDKNFAVGMGVLMSSVLEHMKKPVHFHIITDELAAKDVQRLEKLAAENSNLTVTVYYINSGAFDNMAATAVRTKAAYYRFLVDRVIENAEKVLYLEADMLCLNDCSELFTADMGDNVAMAVSEGSGMRDLFKGRYDYHGDDYFDSGMLLINPENWRKENVSAECIALLMENDFKYQEQDALNAVICQKIKGIDGKYNTLKPLTSTEADYGADTVFLHFADYVKPWHKWGERHELTKLWLEYRDRSLWRDEPVVQPTNYEHAKFMAQMHNQYNETGKALKWKMRYILWKSLRNKKRTKKKNKFMWG